MKRANILAITLAVLFTFATMGLAQETKSGASQTPTVPAATVAPVPNQQPTKETNKKVRKHTVKKHNKVKKSAEKKSEEVKK